MNLAADQYISSIENFVLIGTNFTKADTQTRSRFAITKATETDVYEKAVQAGYRDFFMLSTCNRTEFYGCVPVSELRSLVSSHLLVSKSDFDRYFYIVTGQDAVRHFFRVVSGLDSQIIGDYEIVCQVKTALDEARRHDVVGTITDRISNFAFQAQKKVKAHTNLSSGKYSVSYAAAELIFHESRSEPFSNILLVGAGEFGATVARNLRHYFPSLPITITNRTRDKADKVAGLVNAEVIDFQNFKDCLNIYDVVITTVGTEHYLIQSGDVKGTRKTVFLDLSVPQAIDPLIKNFEGVSLFSVDEVSAFHNELLQQRKLEIPRAETIIDLYVDQLIEWHHVYNHRDVVLKYKEKAKSLMFGFASDTIYHTVNQDKKLEKAFSLLIQDIREQGYAGCRLIETMSSLVPVENDTYRYPR